MKTEQRLSCSVDLVKVLASSHGPLEPYFGSHTWILGVIIDNVFKLDKHVSLLVRTSKSNLQQILARKSMKTFSMFLLHLTFTLLLIQQFICYNGQRNASTPILPSLHWLSVRYRIHFKIILFVSKSLNGLVLQYLSDLNKPVSLLKP